MNSSRLPGKVLMPLAGRPVLSWVVRAAVQSQSFQNVVIATSTDASDDDIADLAERLGVESVRGSLTDVLARFVTAIDAFPGDSVVRLTSDCPLLDPGLIRLLVGAFQYSELDYLSTTRPRSLPRGLDVEIVKSSALREADAEAKGADRSHVTSFIYSRPRRFRIGGISFRPDCSRFRVTVDEPADAVAVAALVELIGDRPPSWREVVELLRRNPQIVALNSGVRQKALREG